jgi:hypothetical protein
MYTPSSASHDVRARCCRDAMPRVSTAIRNRTGQGNSGRNCRDAMPRVSTAIRKQQAVRIESRHCKRAARSNPVPNRIPDRSQLRFVPRNPSQSQATTCVARFVPTVPVVPSVPSVPARRPETSRLHANPERNGTAAGEDCRDAMPRVSTAIRKQQAVSIASRHCKREARSNPVIPNYKSLNN